jgi:putative glutamine amidotransferase
MNKPIIALNMAYDKIKTSEGSYIFDNYVQAIIKAGGTPLLIPTLEDDSILDEYFSLANGFLFIGGSDYDPRLFGDFLHPQTILTRIRPKWDIILFQKALATNLPILGICAGCQLLNMTTGGKLNQHLDNADSYHRNGLIHKATLTKEAFWMSKGVTLDSTSSNVFTVNSYHHQAVMNNQLGQNIIISAYADDNTVEAIELDDKTRMVLGVQFHPERMGDTGSGYFNLLVKEAKKNMEK